VDWVGGGYLAHSPWPIGTTTTFGFEEPDFGSILSG
jgi:hypothetical protein